MQGLDLQRSQLHPQRTDCQPRVCNPPKNNLTDKSQIRAAVYAHLIQIAKSPNRTKEEKALMDWLTLQVKQTRIEAARLALSEYDRWARDPWKYQLRRLRFSCLHSTRS